MLETNSTTEIRHQNNSQDIGRHAQEDSELQDLEIPQPELLPLQKRPRTMEDPPTSLIDAMPKNKQRHIFSLVSGLQGGIDHLQRELDSLKRALGFDDE